MELKVLCRIHHINVVSKLTTKGDRKSVEIEECTTIRLTRFYFQVELLGYASGDDHLYLVYDYVQNGSLNDHLHDPLLKGKYKRLCFSECDNIKESSK